MHRGEVIALVSGKGGTGKSTAAVNLGWGLAKLRYETVVVDLDFGLRSCDLLMGMEDRVLYDLSDVLEGRVRVEDALLTDARYPGLCLLPAPQRPESALPGAGQMQKLLCGLRERFDFILLDAPPGLGEGFQAATEECDRVLVVMTPDRASVRAADQVIRLLRGTEREQIGLLLNRYRGKSPDSPSPEETAAVLTADLFGVIEEDETAASCLQQGTLVTGRACSAGQAYAGLSRKLAAAHRSE